ncbi:gonadoliberin III, partial [Vibrio anguillarum]|nr:gonadoliberin III [Vibrio anguillarum]
TRELIKNLNDADSQNASLLLNKMSKVDATQKLLSYSQIPNKVVGVIQLEDGRRRQTIQHMNEIWNGDQWV